MAQLCSPLDRPCMTRPMTPEKGQSFIIPQEVLDLLEANGVNHPHIYVELLSVLAIMLHILKSFDGRGVVWLVDNSSAQRPSSNRAVETP